MLLPGYVAMQHVQRFALQPAHPRDVLAMKLCSYMEVARCRVMGFARDCYAVPLLVTMVNIINQVLLPD